MRKYVVPDNPDSRQVLILLNDADIQSFSYEEGAAKLLEDPNCTVLQVPYPGDNEIVNELKNRHLYRRGSILLQSPFDHLKYEEISMARKVFPLDKHMYFSQICSWLGVKKLSVVQVERRSSRRDRETKTNVKVARVVNGRLDTKDTQISKLSQSMTLCDEYDGSKPNIRKAIEVAKATGLTYDTTINSLINIRQNPDNKLLKRELEFSISNETERIINVVFNLDVPTYVKVDFNYKDVIQTKSEFVLTVRVEF